MLASLLFLLALPLQGAQGAGDSEEGCIVCHGAEATRYARGVHASVGLGCTGCHGGDPAAIEKDPAHGDGFLSLADPFEKVESCGGCHADAERMDGYGVRTDQLETYWTSAHGKALAERGDPGVATCVTCHGDHLVFGVSDPRSPVHKFSQPSTCGSCHGDAERMEPYGLDADVVEEYAGSVHGRALLGESKLASPTCSDCHGSHGAVPPRVHVVGRVCGQCHTVVGKYFDESPHADATARGEMDECASCHGTHGVAEPTADLFVGPGAGHCSTCHRDSDDPAVAVAKKLYDDVNQLDSAIVSAERELEEASAGGLFIQREYGFLDDARSLRGRARSITHTLSAERLADLLHKGQAMVQETHESLAVKRRKLRDRRIFSSIFFGVTLLLAGVLQTYRREVYGGWKKRGVEDGA